MVPLLEGKIAAVVNAQRMAMNAWVFANKDAVKAVAILILNETIAAFQPGRDKSRAGGARG